MLIFMKCEFLCKGRVLCEWPRAVNPYSADRGVDGRERTGRRVMRSTVSHNMSYSLLRRSKTPLTSRRLEV